MTERVICGRLIAAASSAFRASIVAAPHVLNLTSSQDDELMGLFWSGMGLQRTLEP